ncbi:hypothetical protein [Janthinobacterium sp. HLX7-2]|uniref:hypothetical protein n=1 Tax=Janthinobacterium sp. HLX7-2 TaxID=1259331 RepID=UPI003F29ACC3
MTRTAKEVELSERLRARIPERFGDRGRYKLLEESSGIPASRWKNLLYGKQVATSEQLDFWLRRFPEDEFWLRTGLEDAAATTFPFGIAPPDPSRSGSIGVRLGWVIEEFASPKGKDLFEYLAKRYRPSTVTAEDWRKVILREVEPTLEMVELICSDRPHFLTWVVLGRSTPIAVDPTDKSSVERWKKHRLDEIERMLQLAKKSAKAAKTTTKEPSNP